MLTVKQEWEELMNNLYSTAVQKFRKTPQYRLLDQRLEQFLQDCALNLPSDDYQTLEEGLDALAHLDSEESFFVYRQGYIDCITLQNLLKTTD